MRNPFRHFKASPEIIRLAVSVDAGRIQWRWHLDEVFVRINGEIYALRWIVGQPRRVSDKP